MWIGTPAVRSTESRLSLAQSNFGFSLRRQPFANGAYDPQDAPVYRTMPAPASEPHTEKSYEPLCAGVNDIHTVLKALKLAHGDNGSGSPAEVAALVSNAAVTGNDEAGMTIGAAQASP